jgi:hypothetical protein
MQQAQMHDILQAVEPFPARIRAAGKAVLWALSLALMLFVPASSSAQDNACSKLKSILADAHSDFAKFRGEVQKPNEWKATLSLDGSTACRIDKTEGFNYRCNAVPVSTEDQAIALADRMFNEYSICLNGAADAVNAAWRDSSFNPSRRVLEEVYSKTGRKNVWLVVRFDQRLDEAQTKIISDYVVETMINHD